MTSKWLFLRWALFASLILAINLIGYNLGFVEKIHQLDPTYICFSIIALFWIMTIYCGILTWKAIGVYEEKHRFGKQVTDNLLERIEHRADNGRYAESICEKLGMLGTVCGFLMMLLGAGGFAKLQNTDPQRVKQLIEQLGVSLSTAFLTTLVGAICGILLGFQYRTLSRAIERWLNEK